ncbi:MAG: DUF3800 domain-containing protein [Clostridiales bacterium]|nr:DUF3800 domain-containing protein [Clostridiales bacterium]
MKQLSVFIDESGDFSFGKESSDYYLITLVFHDQDDDLNHLIIKLDEKIKKVSSNINVIHTGPIIRQKDEYSSLTIDDRRDLIFSFYHFIRKLPIRYHTIAIKKRECKNHDDLVSRLSKELHRFAVSHLDYFMSFDQVIVYYDNGQQEIKNMLNTVFSINFTNVEFRVVRPLDYRLFQVSDYLCSFELLFIKQAAGTLSKAEKQFFYKPQELKKQFLKELHKKIL